MDKPTAKCRQDPGVFIPIINRNKCEGKGDCIEVCPFDVFTMGVLPKEERGNLTTKGKIKGFAHGWKQALVTKGEQCCECGLCVQYCPEKAITLKRMKS